MLTEAHDPSPKATPNIILIITAVAADHFA